MTDNNNNAEPIDDMTRVRELVNQIGTAYKAATLINQHLAARGYEYRMARSTIDSMHNRGKGRPAMVAFVRHILEQINDVPPSPTDPTNHRANHPGAV